QNTGSARRQALFMVDGRRPSATAARPQQTNARISTDNNTPQNTGSARRQALFYGGRAPPFLRIFAHNPWPMLVYSTAAYEYYAVRLVNALQAESGLVERRAFPDGEIYHRLETSPWN